MCTLQLPSFSPVLWSSSDQTPLAFKARFTGYSFSHCWSPRLRSLTPGSELSILWKTFCDVSSSLWATHLADIRFDLIMITSLLLSCCDSFLSLDTGYLFGSFHPFFVAVADGSLAVCCDFSVFLRSGSYHLSILPTCFILSFILL